LTAGAFAFALALVSSVGCGRDAAKPPESRAVVVQTRIVAPAREVATVEAVGSLQSAREATLAGKVMGTVTEIRKHAGDSVRQGEVLLTVDSRDVAGQIAQAEGALAQAKAAAALAETNFSRFEKLQPRGSASQLELDQARYQRDTAIGAVVQAEGALATARSYRGYADLAAPFAGRVVDQLCEVGDLASPGRPLMKLEDPSRQRLYASLDAARAAAAIVGSAASVRVPALGDHVFAGKVLEVVPAADPMTRSVLVKIELEPDPALRSGLFARALLPAGERRVLRVPRSALVRRGDITGCFVNEAGRAAFRMLVVSSDGAGDPEVLSGLAEGDALVLDPPPGLLIGSRLEVR
jgi:RND family efflux transporter MFP subunit